MSLFIQIGDLEKRRERRPFYGQNLGVGQRDIFREKRGNNFFRRQLMGNEVKNSTLSRVCSFENDTYYI